MLLTERSSYSPLPRPFSWFAFYLGNRQAPRNPPPETNFHGKAWGFSRAPRKRPKVLSLKGPGFLIKTGGSLTTPNYSKHGKLTQPLTDAEFADRIENGPYESDEYRAWPVGLYYTAVRKLELWRALRDQFSAKGDFLFFEVGVRLKKVRRVRKDGTVLNDQEYLEALEKAKTWAKTPPLPIPIKAPFVELLVDQIERADWGERVFPWSPRTCYNIVDRAFGAYNHYFRLSRVTWFFSPHPELGRPEGYSISEVKNWTGLSLQALNYYIGLANLQRMGAAFLPQTKKRRGRQ